MVLVARGCRPCVVSQLGMRRKLGESKAARSEFLAQRPLSVHRPPGRPCLLSRVLFLCTGEANLSYSTKYETVVGLSTKK